MSKSMTSELPLFVYGSLMPGEIAFNLISGEVERSESAILEGAVTCVRDGFPFVHIDPSRWGASSQVPGHLLFSKERRYREMLDVAILYENPQFYELVEVDVKSNGQTLRAQVFSGKAPKRDDVVVLEEPWRSSNNPLFAHAFAQIGIELKELLNNFELNPAIFPTVYWPQMVRVEGLFLVLTSILEHLISLKYGYGEEFQPGSTPLQPNIKQPTIRTKLKAFSFENDWKTAFTQVRIPEITVFDVWERNKSFNSSNQTQALYAWYAVRSNLGHRGKSSWKDADKVLKALVGLYSTMRAYLLIALPGIESGWQVMDPSGAPICLYPKNSQISR
jgi:gamma-glutamylcyclotransferase (GGCT)/AIG2-like uncharacterized protein YtfP